MTCRPCTSLQESAADCLPTSFSDTRQLSLLNGNHTPVESCANEPQKDGFHNCTCGKAMSGCSIHPNTRDEWIASMRDSLAKTLALLESRQAYLMEPDQVFTVKSCVLLASFDRDSCSWRTLQQSFLTGSEPFSQTWPRWGMTAGGSAYAHPMSERRITETDGSFLLLTPSAQAWKAWTFRNPKSLIRKNHADGNLQEQLMREFGLMITPLLEERLMMFPDNWTRYSDGLKALETLKSRSKPQQRIDCLEVSE